MTTYMGHTSRLNPREYDASNFVSIGFIVQGRCRKPSTRVYQTRHCHTQLITHTLRHSHSRSHCQAQVCVPILYYTVYLTSVNYFIEFVGENALLDQDCKIQNIVQKSYFTEVNTNKITFRGRCRMQSISK